MNPQEVKKRIASIRSKSGDDELAHAMEDELHQDVLRAIVGGICEEYAECARLALTTIYIDFARRCS